MRLGLYRHEDGGHWGLNEEGRYPLGFRACGSDRIGVRATFFRSLLERIPIVFDRYLRSIPLFHSVFLSIK